MRTIKFRGKTPGGKWVYGDLVREGGISHIVDENGTYFMVHTHTVGQFTGLLDIEKKEVYEGDILAFPTSSDFRFVAEFHNGCFDFRHGEIFVANPMACVTHIIGNIHDDPELVNINP